MDKKLSKLKWFSDPSHGWLRVPKKMVLVKKRIQRIFDAHKYFLQDSGAGEHIASFLSIDLPDLDARKHLWSKMLVEQIPLLETREEFINWAAELSEGFSGREIRTCMRLALPKALLEAEQLNEEPKLKLEQLKEVIHRINHAKLEVASKSNTLSNDEIRSAKSLLGIKS